MTLQRTQISVKGRQIEVPLIQVAGFDIVAKGGWLKQATIKDEDYVEMDPSGNPEELIAGIRQQRLKADIFSFAQRIPDTGIRHNYTARLDNVAAVPLTTFDDWWNALPQATRKNVRRSERRGVVASVASLNQHLAEGIKGIYDETPIRQGRRFWHYGKDVATVTRENSSYADRSDFIAAYYQEELIGFIKIVYAGKMGQIMQILSKNQHFDKRPGNALIAKAVEVCCRKGMAFFVYGKYIYGNKSDSELIEFKRRNGFKQLEYPRYYVPLTLLGRMAITSRLHLGLRNLLPAKIESGLLNLRSKYYASRLPAEKAKAGAVELDPKEEAGS